MPKNSYWKFATLKRRVISLDLCWRPTRNPLCALNTAEGLTWANAKEVQDDDPGLQVEVDVERVKVHHDELKGIRGFHYARYGEKKTEKT